MVAIAYRRDERLDEPSELDGWPELDEASPSRPPLTLVGPRDSLSARQRSRRALFRRRRIAALIGLLVLIALIPVAGVATVDLLRGGSLTAPEQVPSARVAFHSYVVQPGDTLWRIAGRLDPGGDERPLVARLASELGGRGLQPGEVLRLP
jgi:hypothetical protein